ncbi:hypothetical protein ARTHRO9AX_160060 [Arthrobacter sp. 9AX]|nr:hypothetical protein ARTHRO9AX_160060 [Arthrobacter sp. 9AX]
MTKFTRQYRRAYLPWSARYANSIHSFAEFERDTSHVIQM